MAVLPIAAPADLPPASAQTTSEAPTSSGMAGGGRSGSYGNTAIRSMRPNAARSLWQYCHNAAEAPARHPRLELSPQHLAPLQLLPAYCFATSGVINRNHRKLCGPIVSKYGSSPIGGKAFLLYSSSGTIP